VIPDWRRPAEGPDATGAGQRAAGVAVTVIQVVVIAGGIFLARRSIRQGRGDPRGATRFALVLFGLGAAFELLQLGGDPRSWVDVLTLNLGRHLFNSGLVWVFYVAVEPYVRRLWPGTLVAWSRALEGKFRDPMVGRHILFGALFGLAISLVMELPTLVAAATGLPTPVPSGAVQSLASTGAYLAGVFGALQSSFAIPIFILLAVLLFRVIFRRPWLAYTAFFLIFGSLYSLIASSWLDAVGFVVFIALVLVLITRLGLLAFVVNIIFSYWSQFSLTLDPSSWFFGQSVVTMACFAGVAVYGFWVSLGDQKVFNESIIDR